MVDTVGRLRASVAHIIEWMNEHGAPLLAENLAPGASQEALQRTEAALGFPLPGELRALWSLHHGQREEMNGFIEALDLLDSAGAVAERESVMMFVGFLREQPTDWAQARATEEEVTSDQWVPFASRDSDSLVVSGVSGRVFSCGKDSPPLQFVAGSLAEWFEQYAARVVADDYAVEEGFGDYYLQRRDRAREVREAESARRRAAYEHDRQHTPLLDRFRAALSGGREDRCQEVLEDALQRGDHPAFESAVALLFSDSRPPEFIAAALQPVLNQVSLSPERWALVEKGGKRLENGAIVDIARVHRAGTQAAGKAEKGWFKRLFSK